MADVIAADDRQMDASGPLTHTTADYAKTEINASRNGFRHKASIHTYPPDSRFVTKILPGQIFYANGRNQIGPFYYVRNARLKNISLF
ncbi:MAG TPA: hypothetical protein DEB39_01755, partial [Planctomycetaceae bacterium]|nr:hypothetical protein [Planctomycetaceae bacterium]